MATASLPSASHYSGPGRTLAPKKRRKKFHRAGGSITRKFNPTRNVQGCDDPLYIAKRLGKREKAADEIQASSDELALCPHVAVLAHEIRRKWSPLDYVARGMWAFTARWEFPDAGLVTLAKGGAV